MSKTTVYAEAINSAEKGNREYKSDVFSMLLENKNYALEVYNVLNHSNYTNPDDIEITYTNHGAKVEIKNDASFLIDGHTNYYEHQSTYNPNMPLRFLIYYVSDIMKIEEIMDDIYGREMIELPTPHFVVFYNGTEKRDEIEVMNLSDLFKHKDGPTDLEASCVVYNINPGFNEELKNQSKVLSGYTTFVEKVRGYRRKTENLYDALKQAIKECIEEGILAEFFKEKENEVIRVIQLDYSIEKREEIAHKKGVKEGIEQEHANTEEQRKRADSLEEEVASLKALVESMQETINELQSGK